MPTKEEVGEVLISKGITNEAEIIRKTEDYKQSHAGIC
jgi:hypothetical protein